MRTYFGVDAHEKGIVTVMGSYEMTSFPIWKAAVVKLYSNVFH